MVSPFLHVQIEKGEKIVQKRWEYKREENGRKNGGKMNFTEICSLIEFRTCFTDGGPRRNIDFG
jgi:hypothetical protein